MEYPPEPIRKFLEKESEIYVKLVKIQEQGWKSEAADEHFRTQRHNADTAAGQVNVRFYKMMMPVADEIQAISGALSIRTAAVGEKVKILDLGAAPGAYGIKALQYNPDATVIGVTLPVEDGGHPMLSDEGEPRVKTLYHDMNLLAGHLGIVSDEIPESHPERAHFIFDHVKELEGPFDLVFCDGRVLRTHPRPDYRRPERYEIPRLMRAQLILALRHIKQGGNLIMLMLHAERWDTMKILQTMDSISDLKLIKPRTAHVNRSSFYMIAQNVNVQGEKAQKAIKEWQDDWKKGTLFVGDVDALAQQIRLLKNADHDNDETAQATYTAFVKDFGGRYVELANPIWQIHFDALEHCSYISQPEVKKQAKHYDTDRWSRNKFSHLKANESTEDDPSSSHSAAESNEPAIPSTTKQTPSSAWHSRKHSNSRGTRAFRKSENTAPGHKRNQSGKSDTSTPDQGKGHKRTFGSQSAPDPAKQDAIRNSSWWR